MFPFYFPRKTAFTLIFLGFIFDTSAQNALPENEIHKLDTVIVTATRRASEALTTPATINVIDSEEIKEHIVTDFRELLRYEPGISVGHGSRSRSLETSIAIRGIGGQRLALMVDGVRLPGGYTAAGATLGQLKVDMSSLRRVEVLRGPASSLYGSDALAGVIVFRTLSPADFLSEGQHFGGNAGLSYSGATNSRAATANLAFATGKVQHLLSATQRRGHELEHNDSSIRLDPQDVHTQNLLLKSVLTPSDAHTFSLIAEHYQQQVETQRPSLLGPIDRGQSTVTASFADDRSDRHHVGVAWQWTPESAWFNALNAQLDYQRSVDKERTHESQKPRTAPAFTRTSLSQYREPQWSASVQLEGDKPLTQTLHRWMGGLDVMLKTVDHSSDALQYSAAGGPPQNVINGETYPRKTAPDTDIRSLGFFVQDEIAFGTEEKLRLTPSVRWDYYRLNPKPDALYANANITNIVPVKLSKSALTPRLGLSYEYQPQHVIYAGYVSGFRMPTHAQLNRIGQVAVRNFIHDFVPAPDLKPERSRGVELGFRGETARGSYDLTGFYNRYSDFIDTQRIATIAAGAPGNPGPREIRRFQSRNIGEVEIYGLEAKGSLALHPWLGSQDHWHLIAASQWSMGNDKSNHQPLNSIQPFKLVTGLRWEEANRRFGGQLMANVVSAKTRVNRQLVQTGANPPVPLTTSGYATLDLNLNARLGEKARLYLGVHNLLDRRYYDWSRVSGLNGDDARLAAYTSPGRTLSASVELGF